jgi:hypothetical protein
MINTPELTAVRRFLLAQLFYSVDESMGHSKQGYTLLNNLIRFLKDFFFLVTQK